MARLPRLYAPNTPQLVQARLARPLASPHDPTPSGALDQLQQWLITEVRQHQLALHGWILLPDRFLLLATPPAEHTLPRIVQGMGRRMATAMIHGRVFEGRYRSTLVDEEWVLPSLTWLETSPVSDGLVDSAAQWPWSSAPEHTGLRADTRLLTDHTAYWGTHDTPYARQAAYRERLAAGLGEHTTRRIEAALSGQWVLGNEDFISLMSVKASRRVAPAPRGRPRRVDPKPDTPVTN